MPSHLSLGTVAEAAGSLGGLLLGDGNDVDRDGVELLDRNMLVTGSAGGKSMTVMVRDATYAEVLQQVLGLDIDVELAALRVLGEVEGGDLGDVLILALSLLFLELEGDTADGATLDTLDQVGGVAGNL